MNHPRLLFPDLFQAVCDDPGHDAPRLRLAEALHIQRHPLAHYIVSAIARVRATPRHALPAWLGTVTPDESAEIDACLEPPHVENFGFDRGLVGTVWMTAKAIEEHLAEVLTLAPVVSIYVYELNGSVDALLVQPLLHRIRALTLGSGRLDDTQIARLAACPALKSLRYLDLSHNRIGDAGLEALAASPHLSKLRFLDLGLNSVPSPVVRWVHTGHEHAFSNGEPTCDNADLLLSLEKRYGPRPWLRPPREWFDTSTPGGPSPLQLCDDEPLDGRSTIH